MPDGQRRPYSMWLSGEYPRVMDGLCKALSLDIRVWDPAWIGMKLRKLLNYAETNGSFLARIPGSDKAQNWPSTIAYLAQLMIHRYAMLGILTEEGYPVAQVGILAVPEAELERREGGNAAGVQQQRKARRIPAAAQARTSVRVGIGDQSVGMFDQPAGGAGVIVEHICLQDRHGPHA